MADKLYRRLSCVDCQSLFGAMSGRGRPRIRCLDCSPENKAAPGAYITNRDRPAICLGCASPYIAHHALSKYCTDQCRNRVHNKARRTSPGASCDRAGCSKRVHARGLCETHYSGNRGRGNHKRRAMRAGAGYVYFNALDILARDKWTCQLCGEPTPKSLRGTADPRAPELDHILPIAAGGAHVPENCQCACRECNRAKGANHLWRPASRIEAMEIS